jgi:hypothetical protein
MVCMLHYFIVYNFVEKNGNIRCILPMIIGWNCETKKNMAEKDKR